MTPAVKSYYIKETLISGVITILFSVGFFYLLFAGVPEIEVADFFVDAFPQSLIGGAFAGVIPAVMTKKHIKKTGFAGGPLLNVGLTDNPFIAGLLASLVTALVCLPILYVGLTVFAHATLDYEIALIIKIAYGFLIGVMASTISVSAMLKTTQ